MEYLITKELGVWEGLVGLGRLFKYSEHPIFRFCPQNQQWLENGKMSNKHGILKEPIKVCVNTYDVYLMPTTIENEHRILKKVAQRILR
ncbi:hypothetical protein EDI28_13965 [Photobacterium chitinilyticum]|uniref:Uncharacterized protein n=1 Tax=Photobacterium chitinilyticum TaxID=2485123 RepID=A0A444JPG2_9GAMM|nr:hypothetical protein EDI28_13965 [Photobacterium chitinilyticum]